MKEECPKYLSRNKDDAYTEFYAKMNESNIGSSECESRANRSGSNTGRVVSAETRAKRTEAIFSVKTRARVNETNIGRADSEESRARASEVKRGMLFARFIRQNRVTMVDGDIGKSSLGGHCGVISWLLPGCLTD
mmetsp:Transcript_15106/g.32060  ORF Transcript_15106/g.32060 Transcript_15106/m.32060 type:complete len:135 (+) Transcript_15106:475-879(+)